MEVKYYEIELRPKRDRLRLDIETICICGTRKPTRKEAEAFLQVSPNDHYNCCCGVREITKDEAYESFNMEEGQDVQGIFDVDDPSKPETTLSEFLRSVQGNFSEDVYVTISFFNEEGERIASRWHVDILRKFRKESAQCIPSDSTEVYVHAAGVKYIHSGTGKRRFVSPKQVSIKEKMLFIRLMAMLEENWIFMD